MSLQAGLFAFRYTIVRIYKRKTEKQSWSDHSMRQAIELWDYFIDCLQNKYCSYLITVLGIALRKYLYNYLIVLSRPSEHN